MVAPSSGTIPSVLTTSPVFLSIRIPLHTKSCSEVIAVDPCDVDQEIDVSFIPGIQLDVVHIQ